MTEDDLRFLFPEMIKESGLMTHMGKQMKRTGKNIWGYGGKALRDPVGAFKQGLRSGSAKLDNEKRFDLMDNALDHALNKGNQIRFDAVHGAGDDAGMFRKGTNWLRQQGVASAGRTTTGKLSADHQQQIRDFATSLEQKGGGKLIHTRKDGSFALHRDAKMEDVDELYKHIQGVTPTGDDIGKFNKFRNSLNYVPLPGERGLILGGAGITAGAELTSKETAQGRKKSLGERVARAGGLGGAGEALALA